MYAECIVVESLLAHLVIVGHCSCLLKRQTCIAAVAFLKVYETNVQQGALRYSILSVNAGNEHLHCLVQFSRRIQAGSQLVQCHALWCVVVLDICGECLCRLFVVSLHELGCTKHLVHAVIFGNCRLVVVEIVSCPVGGTCSLSLLQPYAGDVVL